MNKYAKKYKKYRKILKRALQFREKRKEDLDYKLGWPGSERQWNEPIEGPTLPNNHSRTPIDSLGTTNSGNEYPYLQ